jgi:hypothetical protein
MERKRQRKTEKEWERETEAEKTEGGKERDRESCKEILWKRIGTLLSYVMINSSTCSN